MVLMDRYRKNVPRFVNILIVLNKFIKGNSTKIIFLRWGYEK